MASQLKDAYGFALLATGEDQRLLQASWAAAKKRADSWSAVSKQLRSTSSSCSDTASGPDQRRSLALKPLVRRGIPFELRPTQWFQLSGAAARQAAAGSGYYAKLSGINGLPVNMLLQVSEDLSPGIFQFRTHPLFKKQEGMDAVRRILCGYLQHNPAGYFRGLAHIAGFLLIVMGLDSEQQAFWTLAALLEDKLFPYCSGQGAYGIKVELRVLDTLVAKKLPKVASHLAKLETNSTAVTPSWLSSLFTTTLPAEVTARIFDCLLLEGSKVLQRVGLALLKHYEASICAASHPAQLRKVLDSRAARLYDAESLLNTAFKGVGAMPTAVIAGVRSAAAAAVDAQMEEQRRRLELIVCRTH
ncbi:hypothetical protein OEZ86_009332 [Tetradesmus obliquus]|nr:hypothetical protein OEZ86_009332 [Tetradesmus obliquus]